VKAIATAAALGLVAGLVPVSAWAWGQEGHSIIAEIAQHRLAKESAATMQKIADILGPGVSLASIASWADAYRDEDEGTAQWHFVDIPIDDDAFDRDKECARTAKGDCIIAELERLKNDVRCKKGEEQRKALMFAVHFVGDIHQPLHTVKEAFGGNTIDVLAFMHGERCKQNCKMTPMPTNLHAAWDTTLIEMTTWDWGSYVTRLEDRWLASADARRPGIDDQNFVRWALDAHKVAQQIWKLTPTNNIPDQPNYEKVVPLVDQQLGLAALRLTRFLKDAFASDRCPVP
jgi:hypothetical protein